MAFVRSLESPASLGRGLASDVLPEGDRETAVTAGEVCPFPRSSRTEPCPVCRSTQFCTIAQRDRRGEPLETVLCMGCGLVSHAVVPIAEILAAFQRSHYRQQYHGETTPSAYRVHREWARAGRLIRWLTPHLRPGDRIVEIGAGIGCNVRRLTDAGYEAFGIEPGEGFCQFAQTTLRAHVTAEFFEDYEPSGPVEALLLVHVLEHLVDPVAALRRAASWLTGHGWIYVEVPDLLAPPAAPHRRYHFAHIYNFTADTLADAAGEAGLIATRIEQRAEGRNLRLLLRPRLRLGTASQPSGGARDQSSAQRSMTARSLASALARESWWSYHTRPAYLTRRTGEMACHLLDRWRGDARLRRIVASQQHGPM